ncbi:Protein of unknown function [Alteribacillus persepolensis]|uniref:DUF3231 family protein n=1 Tax=Alteribacillus persepolensis TaxID=568899 RepID=A0A1G8EHF0_9BACI|nr:DUF3231 family protein [Alteribacillus persepolensis]SDH69139.1 Protein of unknown function [Alteribacillus persepolensis]
MGTEKDARLTSAELSQLWATYQNDSGSLCILKYFLKTVEDAEIRPILEHALQLSQAHIQILTDIFTKENYPLPKGFSEDQDLNINAPRLFTDNYMLQFLSQMSNISLSAYSVSKSLAVRSDIDQFFGQCLTEVNQMNTMVKEILLEKGLYIRSPYIPYPQNIDFVKKQNFLTGWFGRRRPLLSMEITNLYANFQRNDLGVATLIGFSQVAKSQKIGQFFVRGKEIASKHNEIFDSILRENDLPVPMASDTYVTESKVSPFSDRLMTFVVTSLIALGMGYYGTSISTSLRRDLTVHYDRLIHEILKYSEDGANILIDNGWMEEPPRASDRDELAKKK